MRRSDREIHDLPAIEAIIGKAAVCRIGLSDNNVPYVIPVNFGYANKMIFIHGANAGRKIEILKKNPTHEQLEKKFAEMGYTISKAECESILKHKEDIVKIGVEPLSY